MKRQIFRLSALLLVGAMAFSACTKEGPMGLPGKDGKDGKDGRDGRDGVDGTAGCIQCHDNSQVNFAITAQWERSLHATGGLFVRNTNTCAGCHTSQGFREIIQTGSGNTAATINNPVPPNCYTCHNVHTTFTPADWGLSTTANVTFRIDPTKSHNFGKGNLCATCHQPRLPSPMPTMDGPSINITSATWGPHYGTAASIVAGKGGFEFGTGYTNSAHVNVITQSCVACHLTTASGIDGGGHMMNLGYTTSTGAAAVITTSCTTCHSNATDLNNLITAKKAELTALKTQLSDRLVQIGMLNPTTGRVNTGTWTSAQAGAFINYKLVSGDKGAATHNFPYAKKLLENSIAAIQ
ncbi:MAG: hypothetical protein LWX09_09015 [Bacteroidia bacterium]|nr:hypothetical protein [Bacteroidia bacterium]